MTFTPGKSGNPGGRLKEKPIRDMFRLVMKEAETNGTPRALRNIIEKVLDKCASGDMDAIKFMAERYEGKLPTPVVGDDDEPALRAAVTIVSGVSRGSE